ncbi:hypothetical protein [Myxococcus qinghaiensis]|uniref:hypothetical protein n=1 Tax=Myxococcus qinghaiensis TaxID=2906758 RepID=UPI0020A78A87|nr:hypothetical protein [Myxococcus qinghaiensis]MCP3165813.1 hypothetical protein [Myxococcus qinghaiensis]
MSAEELNPFLSTTARLTAGSVPFHALSDGKHLFLSSNYELIQRLEPYVREHLGSQARLADATRHALQRYLPELLPQATQVIQYLSLYYEVPS